MPDVGRAPRRAGPHRHRQAAEVQAAGAVLGGPGASGQLTVSFTAEIWEHGAAAAWHFLSLPQHLADDLEAEFGHRAAGFGSLRVEVTIGETTWQTSLFPDQKRSTYVLPLKKAVRAAEGLSAGSAADVELVVLA